MFEIEPKQLVKMFESEQAIIENKVVGYCMEWEEFNKIFGTVNVPFKGNLYKVEYERATLRPFPVRVKNGIVGFAGQPTIEYTQEQVERLIATEDWDSIDSENYGWLSTPEGVFVRMGPGGCTKDHEMVHMLHDAVRSLKPGWRFWPGHGGAGCLTECIINVPTKMTMIGRTVPDGEGTKVVPI